MTLNFDSQISNQFIFGSELTFLPTWKKFPLNVPEITNTMVRFLQMTPTTNTTTLLKMLIQSPILAGCLYKLVNWREVQLLELGGMMKFKARAKTAEIVIRDKVGLSHLLACNSSWNSLPAPAIIHAGGLVFLWNGRDNRFNTSVCLRFMVSSYVNSFSACVFEWVRASVCTPYLHFLLLRLEWQGDCYCVFPWYP